MKKLGAKKGIAVLLVLVLSLAGCFEDYTKREKILFYAMVSGHSADLYTTLDRGYDERNPFLGDNPSRSDLALMKLGGIGVTILLGELFPDYREIIFSASAAISWKSAIYNYQNDNDK